MLQADGRVLRIGHRGAAALAPENTLASLAKAVELGVDLVEFDVLDLSDGTLVLAHSDDLHEVSHGGAEGSVRGRSLEELRRVAPELPTLDGALELLAAAAVGVHVDLKRPGTERPVVDALRRHALVERSLVSSVHPDSLRRIASLEPSIARGLTYPRARKGVATRPLLPHRIADLLARAQATAAVLHHGLVTRSAVQRCHALDAPVLAWTVDRPALLRHLVALGVDGVITNDPRIFLSTLPS